MRRSNLVLFGYLLLIFASGVVVGAFGYRLYDSRSAEAKTKHWSPEDYRRRYTEVMRDQVGLDKGQLLRLNQILDETKQRYEELERDVICPRKRAIRAAKIKEIEAMLTDRQRAAYEKIRRRHAEARKRRLDKQNGSPTRSSGGGSKRQ